MSKFKNYNFGNLINNLGAISLIKLSAKINVFKLQHSNTPSTTWILFMLKSKCTN